MYPGKFARAIAALRVKDSVQKKIRKARNVTITPAKSINVNWDDHINDGIWSPCDLDGLKGYLRTKFQAAPWCRSF